ncbi:MAG: hypothetical protein AAF491_05370, partial [Verrucomicrobiota bacterium]
AGWDSEDETDEVKTVDSPEESEPIFESDPEPSEAAAPAEKPELFGGKPTNETGESLFGSPAPADSESGPPPFQSGTTEEESPASGKSGNGLFSSSAPQVTSQPLGSKPPKRKGKGLLVLLVILLGLVCGAALASFVLPVDEYVAKARSFMEEKLNQEVDVDPAAFLSEMMVPDSAGTATPESQPAPAQMTPAPAVPPQPAPEEAPASATAPVGAPPAPVTAPAPAPAPAQVQTQTAPPSEAAPAVAPSIQTPAPQVAPQAPASAAGSSAPQSPPAAL